MSTSWSYEGQRVVVTGCSSGMGEATAEELRVLGAEVIGLDVKPPAVQVDAYVTVDLEDPASIDAAVSALPDRIDALFNCAGISGSNPPRQVFAINFLGTRELTDQLIDRIPPGGAVASISSLGGARWAENLAAVQAMLRTPDVAAGLEWVDAHPEQLKPSGYSFAKQCLIGYTMQKAWELGPQGKRFNCISPSPTDTPMLANSATAVGQHYLDSFPRPLGRNAQSAEMARPLAFLNSGAASYVNGQNLSVDGGFMAGIGLGHLDRNLIAGVPGVARAQPGR